MWTLFRSVGGCKKINKKIKDNVRHWIVSCLFLKNTRYSHVHSLIRHVLTQRNPSLVWCITLWLYVIAWKTVRIRWQRMMARLGSVVSGVVGCPFANILWTFDQGIKTVFYDTWNQMFTTSFSVSIRLFFWMITKIIGTVPKSFNWN